MTLDNLDEVSISLNREMNTFYVNNGDGQSNNLNSLPISMLQVSFIVGPNK